MASGFDMNVIPPENRNKAQVAAHLEIWRRSQDICRVHNPTDEDFVVYNDRQVTNERWVIPAQTKDIGPGKGNKDVPRYIAERYLDKMGGKLIQEKSKAHWEIEKTKYRLEERGQMEERLAIRVTDKREWDIITPMLFLGVVKRYEDTQDYVPEPPSEPKKPTFSSASSALDRLGLADAEVGFNSQDELEDSGPEDAKTNLINQIV